MITVFSIDLELPVLVWGGNLRQQHRVRLMWLLGDSQYSIILAGNDEHIYLAPSQLLRTRRLLGT